MKSHSIPLCRYENVTSEGGDNVTVDLVSVLEEVLEVLMETEVVAMESTPATLVEGEVDYVIPDDMRVTIEPREQVFNVNHLPVWAIVPVLQ